MAQLRGRATPGVFLGLALGITALIALNALVGNSSTGATDTSPRVSLGVPVEETTIAAPEADAIATPTESVPVQANDLDATPADEPEGEAVMSHVTYVPGLSAD